MKTAWRAPCASRHTLTGAPCRRSPQSIPILRANESVSPRIRRGLVVLFAAVALEVLQNPIHLIIGKHNGVAERQHLAILLGQVLDLGRKLQRLAAGVADRDLAMVGHEAGIA